MEINRAVPTLKDGASDEALRQALDYLRARPFRFSCRTSCCKKFRQNSKLIDPGYYLNGAPSCQQLGLTCESQDEDELDAIADGLVPGSLVFAPKNENQFWPAIVDFSPDEAAHFVIFRYGGPLCCTPYAYYVSFVPDWTAETYGGWFTADKILPFETLVRKPIRMSININDPHYDYAYEDANTNYSESLKARLERYSLVCQTLERREPKPRRNGYAQSPGRSITGKVALQAQRLSQEIARRFAPGAYARVEQADGVSLASTSSSSSSSKNDQGALALANRLNKKLLLTPTSPDNPEYYEEISFLTLEEFGNEQDHCHSLPEDLLPQDKTDGREIVAGSSGFVNPTQHAQVATHELYKRSAIQAILKSGVREVRVYRTYPVEGRT